MDDEMVACRACSAAALLLLLQYQLAVHIVTTGSKHACTVPSSLTRSQPLNRRRRLRADIKHHPVDSLHLVREHVADLAQELKEEREPRRRHEVGRLRRSQGNELAVGPLVSLHATARKGSSTAKACEMSSYKPALRISSM